MPAREDGAATQKCWKKGKKSRKKQTADDLNLSAQRAQLQKRQFMACELQLSKAVIEKKLDGVFEI